MANNRLWLIHRPLKIGLYLGKRFDLGWYDAPDNETIQKFYSVIEEEGLYDEQDDFCLFLEDNDRAPCVTSWETWEYTNSDFKGFPLFEKAEKIELTEEKAYQLHYEMWDWLSKNPDKWKPDWPQWKQNGGDIPDVDAYCFLCATHKNCAGCPLHPCDDSDSPYIRWRRATTPEDRALYAAEVRDIGVI